VTGLRRFVPLLAVGGLLAAAAVAASLATPQITSVPSPLTHRTPGPTASAPVPEGATPKDIAGHVQDSYTPSNWLTYLITGLCAAIVLVVVVLVVWTLVLQHLTVRRRRVEVVTDEVAAPGRREAVLAAVDAGLSGLEDDDADPRRAVIACWLRLEEAAAAAGTPRKPGDAPADLVLRLLAAHQVSAAVLLPLAEVYRLARYATHTVDMGMRDSARAALRQLRAELSNEPAIGSAK
jgi:hypothetical protein